MLSFTIQWRHESKNFGLCSCRRMVLGGAAFGQSLQIKGNVSCITSSQIEVKCDDGTTWVVKLIAGSTTLNPPSPTVGTAVTVGCKSPDAQRKENPTWTPAPCSTPKPTATPSQ
ncbi:MAG TPA: hypothetical protein VGM65_01770 [Candidatus Udaeobacter sp.]